MDPPAPSGTQAGQEWSEREGSFMALVVTDVETLEEMEEALAIRREVFVHEQKVPPELELDGLDGEALHVLARENTLPVGTGRILIRRDQAKIGRIAVRKTWRARGFGTAILKKLVEMAAERGIQDIFLHAQETALHFYKRLGFIPEGKTFEEAGIPHRRMRLLLKEDPSRQ